MVHGSLGFGADRTLLIVAAAMQIVRVVVALVGQGIQEA
jgi:hypothetical protein